tara:strand:- start:1037 stop:1918 length:882 start_codon:yes stop_codon:yes gene_type:complete
MHELLKCLGTAKLDNPNYGYSNLKGRDTAKELIISARKFGVHSFDTSPRYNNSEKIIGEILYNKENNIFFSSKIDNLDSNSEYSINKMLNSVKSSISKLKIDKLDLCFLHQDDIKIISDKYIQKGIKLLKEYGLISYAGTSIYSKNELDYTIESNFYDWVQIPLSIINNYFYNYILRKNTKIKVAARSVLIQGMLFQDYEIIRQNVSKGEEMISKLDNIKKKLNIKNNKDFKKISIAYLSYLNRLSMVIIGTNSVNNLKFFLNSLDYPVNESQLRIISENSNFNYDWCNPRNW